MASLEAAARQTLTAPRWGKFHLISYKVYSEPQQRSYPLAGLQWLSFCRLHRNIPSTEGQPSISVDGNLQCHSELLTPGPSHCALGYRKPAWRWASLRMPLTSIWNEIFAHPGVFSPPAGAFPTRWGHCQRSLRSKTHETPTSTAGGRGTWRTNSEVHPIVAKTLLEMSRITTRQMVAVKLAWMGRRHGTPWGKTGLAAMITGLSRAFVKGPERSSSIRASGC